MRLILHKDSLYKWIYAIALITPFLVRSFEFNVITAILFLTISVADCNLRISKNMIISFTILALIFSLGFVVHFFYENTLYDVAKDTLYLLKPLIYMLLGYFIASKIKDKDLIFKTIIYVGIILAIIHFITVLFFLIDTADYKISAIRNIGGKDNFVELLVCALLIFNKKNKYFELKLKYKKLVYFVLAISFIMYFSRTMMVALLIILLAANGYARLSQRTLIILSSLFLAVLIFYRILFSLDIDRGAEGFEGFLYKIKIAPSEIFSFDVNLKDAAERWDKWRSYEALKALEEVSDTPGGIGFVFGKGLGSLIDLGFEAQLGKEPMRYIPKIHNGYVYIIFKTGIIGLIFYLLFFTNLYLQTYKKVRTIKSGFINNMIAAIALFYIFTSLIISGIFNPEDVITLFLGALLFLQHHYREAR
ncbi:O-antigen ligase family protein [Winogradskyella aquimaris]|uniref:O-antigen ligase family protein n=1 Tax=Winogradskyella aquimaris TaxID=864074 RepID=A0ABU5EKJ9_9FLAO|nr:O-antigen ligase family protein [Winogradskyella aquimaris]MDY2586481.1 O-antigen ligase family protein [Winogradskyella aquimaris]